MKNLFMVFFLTLTTALFFNSNLSAQEARGTMSTSEATMEVAAAGKSDPAKAAAELKKIFQDMLSDYKAGNREKVKAAVDGLKLASYDKWFAEKFGADKAKGLTAEYDEMIAVFEQEFGKLLEKVVKGGEREVLVYMIAPEGVMREATGLQKDAIAAMKNPCPLFTVKFVKPGESSGISVWSLVLQDGSFKFIGKLRKLK